MVTVAPAPAVDPGRRWLRRGAGTLGAALLLGLAPATGAAAEEAGCPPGIDEPGLVTFDEALASDRVVAGLATPGYEARFVAGFDAIDVNGDGLICLKAVSLLRGSSARRLVSYYQAVDNEHPER